MKFTASMLIADAWALWRADRDVLTGVAAVFVFMPVLAVALLLEPGLARAMAAIGPDDSAERFTAWSMWLTQSAPWLVLAQIVANLGTLTMLMLYLDRPRPDLARGVPPCAGVAADLFRGDADRVAACRRSALPRWWSAISTSLARLSLVGPVMVAERVANPFTAIARSFALTRGHGWALTAVTMIVLLGGYIAQSPFGAVDAWMAVHAPNPIARAIVDIAASAIRRWPRSPRRWSRSPHGGG